MDNFPTFPKDSSNGVDIIPIYIARVIISIWSCHMCSNKDWFVEGVIQTNKMHDGVIRTCDQ